MSIYDFEYGVNLADGNRGLLRSCLVNHRLAPFAIWYLMNRQTEAQINVRQNCSAPLVPKM